MTDADISPNGAPFTFDILSGKNPAFRVDSDGTVKTASLLKSKVQEVYHMKVRVFDNGKPTLTSDTNLTIKVRIHFFACFFPFEYSPLYQLKFQKNENVLMEIVPN